jgi:GGDEF domain-containing protein
VDLVSLKGILRNGKPAAADYVRSLQTLLAGISRYTINGREDELAAFRETLLRLSSEIREQSPVADLDKTVAASLEHLRDYNDRFSKLNAGKIAELKSVMRTMTETITFLSESRTRSVHQLQFVERAMEQSVQLDDIRLLRSKLTSCLDIVREETVRIQTESKAHSEAVGAHLARPQTDVEPPPRFGSMDQVTGLPSRKLAEQALSDAVSGTQDFVLALFIVNRLPGINARYGREIGDEVMLRVSNHFAQHLASSTLLYRWSGPALVAIAETHGKEQDIRAAWTKTASQKHEFSLDSQQRSIFVMAETSVSFFAANAATSLQELFRALDHAVAGYTESEATAK